MFCICAMLFIVDPNECDVAKGAPGPPGPPGLQGELGQKGKNITGIISERILFRSLFLCLWCGHLHQQYCWTTHLHTTFMYTTF